MKLAILNHDSVVIDVAVFERHMEVAPDSLSASGLAPVRIVSVSDAGEQTITQIDEPVIFNPPEGMTLVPIDDQVIPGSKRQRNGDFLPPEPPKLLAPSVTKRQLLLHLVRIGKTENDIDLVAQRLADPAHRLAWRHPDNGRYLRDDPMIEHMARGLGIEDIDAAFNAAAKL